MWLAPWLITAALCAPASWYGSSALQTAWWTETNATPADVRQLARAADVRQIVVVEPSGESSVVWANRRDRLDGVDEASLDLLSLVLRVEGGVGVEMDLLAPAERSWRGLTATWSPEGVVTLEQGPALEVTRPAPASREDLQNRYRLGPISDLDLHWTPHELGMLGAALETLTEAERARVVGVAFHRVSKPTETPLVEPLSGTQLGAMTLGGSFGMRVEVFSQALTSGFRFIGPVDEPVPFALHGLVHELAHVIASAPDIARVQRLVADLESYEAARQRHAAAVEAYNERAAASGDSGDSGEHAQLFRTLEQLEQDQVALEARRRALDTTVAELEALPLYNPPAVVAWTAFLDGRPAPTLYGRQAHVEGFADAFALWKLDPDALERAVPGAVAWFEAGNHLVTR